MDGNTARRFFSNPNLKSEITGIDLNVIKRFKNILTAISCGREINSEAFDSYVLDTAK
jgi:hypothetical protein